MNELAAMTETELRQLVGDLVLQVAKLRAQVAYYSRFVPEGHEAASTPLHPGA